MSTPTAIEAAFTSPNEADRNGERANVFAIARAIDGLVFALKYSRTDGKSVAEAIEMAGEAIARILP